MKSAITYFCSCIFENIFLLTGFFMKVRQILTGLTALFMLSGCSSMDTSSVTNLFEQPSITESYISQFSDIPIPAPMSSKVSESLVTVGQDGSKFGLESFSGRVDGVSLANVMMQNMSRQGWQLRGSSVGVRSIQLYEKSPHYAALFFREGKLSTTMDVWVINGVNVDILNLVPQVHNQIDSSSSSYNSGTAGISSSSSGQVTKLSN